MQRDGDCVCGGWGVSLHFMMGTPWEGIIWEKAHYTWNTETY